MVVIIIIGLAIIILIITGQASSPSGNTFSTQDCKKCILDKNWYQSLPGWKKTLHAVWWAARWSACKIKGCF